jgi:hypothetical protein
MENKYQLAEIYQIPQILPEIKEAVLNERIAVFIGAGVSRMIGCSGWKELANQLAEAAYENSLINYQEKEKIIENYGPRKTITIFKKILPEEIYRDTLNKSLSAKEEKIKKYPIYEKLFKMRGVYLTTNIDTYFDQYFEPAKIFVRPHQFKPENINLPSLFHLHGSLNDFSTIIFTTQDYIKHYNTNEIKDFLKHIFTKFTMLFVGYNLSELEILDYVLLKGSPFEEKYTEFRHSILLPFYKVERNTFKFEREYYATLNMSAVPYAIDEKGYEQLYYIIEAWEKEINTISPFLYKSYRFIEQNIDDYIEKNAIEVFQLIKNDEHFRDHFFRSLKTVKWFYPLKEKRYFAPERAPGPKHADKQGSFIIPEWNVLPYLERVSQQVIAPGNERYIDELLKIINDVSKYKDENSQYIDNYRTWWYFVKILLNIPNEKIPIEIIELIPIWLDSKFDVDLHGAEIATKLLPKFLPDTSTDNDIKKAEIIIEIITSIKTFLLNEERSKLLGKKEEFKLAIDPYWLKEVFEKHAEIIGKKCTNKVVEDLAKNIKVLLKKKESKIPLKIENKEYLLVFSEKDNSYVIKVLSVGEMSQFKIYDEVFSEQESKGIVLEKLSIDKCNEENFVNMVYKHLNKKKLFRKVEKSTLKRKIRNLYHNFYDEGTYKSFYEESEYYLTDPMELLTFILKRILDKKAKQNINGTKLLLKDFLKDNYFYFQKMAVYIIGQNIESYEGLFWELLDSCVGDFIMENFYFGDEMKHLMQNLKNLLPEQKEKLKAKIEAGPKEYVPEEDSEKYIALWRQKRYQALSSDTYFRELYDEKKKTTKVDAEMIPAIGKIKFRWGSGPSPLRKEEILKINNDDFAKFLSIFKPRDFLEGPSIDGLSNMIKETVNEKPEKFISDLSSFLSTGYLYIYDILWGVRDAWNNKKSIDWEKLFIFIKQYISGDDFWQDKYKTYNAGWNATHKWVIGMIGELIQDGTKDDNWAFKENQLPVAQEIIFYIIDRLNKEEEKEITDPVTHALNSPRGKIITALIYLALRIARLEDKIGIKKEDRVRWSEDLKIKYEKTLSDEIIESYTLFGQYMPNLYYLDKSWVKQRIKQFEKIEKEQLWSSFMTGYLFLNRIYDDLYRLMSGNYFRAVSYSFKERDANERLVHHIAIGYLRSVEDFSESSLFGKMLIEWKGSQIEELINYFWMQHKPLKEDSEFKDKIIGFWRILYERYKEKESLHDGDKKILSTAAKLSVFLSKLDKESYEWLMLSASNMPTVMDSHFLIEYLDELKDKGIKVESGRYVGNIFLKLLELFTPTYKEEHIRSIVKYLYACNNSETKDLANRICIIYGTRGVYFLRNLYEKYNK